MPWRPILDGATADAARQVARELALDLAQHRGSVVDRTVFWAYAASAFDETFATEAFHASVDELIARLARGGSHPMLHNGGLCGIGWALAHVVECGDSYLARIDDAMLRVLAAPSWRGDYDLAQGLVGFAVYFLERLRGGDVPAARDGLARIVAHLAATARHTDDGAHWPTRAELLSAAHRERYPDGRDDFGLAHGLAGAVAMLARAAAIAEPTPGARELCVEAARFLVSQRRAPTEIGSRFPSLLAPNATYEPCRAAWCYGDLGVAFALWSAEAAVGAAPGLALETALDCARRPGAHVPIVDSALCHGSAGMAHLYNRLHQASGEVALREAAQRWFETTIGADRERHLNSGPGLVNGTAGVALALLAATSPMEPAWDRMLLCDLPAQ